MDYDWITPRIALGSGLKDRHDARELVACGVSHVVNLCSGRTDDEHCTGLAVTLGDFGMVDGPGEGDTGRDTILAAIRYIESVLLASTEHKVYLHCAQGISRSAAVMVGLLMRAESLGLTQALQAVQRLRPRVNPHPSHLASLLEIAAGQGA